MICFRQICKNAHTETRKCDKNEETQMWNNAYTTKTQTKTQTRKYKNMQKHENKTANVKRCKNENKIKI